MPDQVSFAKGNTKPTSGITTGRLYVVDSSTTDKSDLYLGKDATHLIQIGATVAQGAKADSSVQSVKVGSTSYSPSSGVVSLPAYPTTLPASDVYAWAKAATKPSYTFSEISDRGEAFLSWGGRQIQGEIGPLGVSISAEHSANRIALIPGAALSFEYSSDGGTTWTDYGYSDGNKTAFCTSSHTVPVGRPNSSTDLVANQSMTRVTLTAQNGTTGYVYTDPKKMLVRVSSATTLTMLVEVRTGTNYKSGGAWVNFGTYYVSGWSGWSDIPLILGTLGGGTTQTSNYWQLRLTFTCTAVNPSYPKQSDLLAIRIYGTNAWTAPSTMANTGHLYTYDMSKNATFPAGVSATNFTENGTALSNKYLALTGGTLSLANADSLKIKRTAAGSGAFITYFNNNQSTNFWRSGMSGDNSYIFTYSGNSEAVKIATNGSLITKGDVLLYTASGDSPRLIFQRGTLTDTYNDWSMIDSAGLLYIQQRGNGSTGWEDRALFTQSGVNFAGSISEGGAALSSKYLGISAKAADSSKLNGQEASYYLNYNNLTNKPTIPITYVSTVNGASGAVTLDTDSTSQSDWLYFNRSGSNVTLSALVNTTTPFIHLDYDTAPTMLKATYDPSYIAGTLSTTNKLATINNNNTWGGANTFTKTASSYNSDHITSNISYTYPNGDDGIHTNVSTRVDNIALSVDGARGGNSGSASLNIEAYSTAQKPFYNDNYYPRIRMEAYNESSWMDSRLSVYPEYIYSKVGYYDDESYTELQQNTGSVEFYGSADWEGWTGKLGFYFNRSQTGEWTMGDPTTYGTVDISEIVNHITCFRGDTTYVTMYDGTKKLISDVKEGDSVLGYDVNKKDYCEAIVIKNLKTGEQMGYNCYVMDDGTTIDIHGDDNFITNVKNKSFCDEDGDYLSLHSMVKNLVEFHNKNDDTHKILKETGNTDGGVCLIHSFWTPCAEMTPRYSLYTSNGTMFVNGLLHAQSPRDTINIFRKRRFSIPDKINSIFDEIAKEMSVRDEALPNDKIANPDKAENLAKLNEAKVKIAVFKKKLADSDYKAMKFAEGAITEEEWLPIKEQRASWRHTVNRMEEIVAEYQPIVEEENPEMFDHDWKYKNKQWHARQQIFDNHLEDFREWQENIKEERQKRIEESKERSRLRAEEIKANKSSQKNEDK